MEYNEEDYLMISGLQHYFFCRRQWALIHIEQLWTENVLTVQGKHLHERADDPFIREKRSSLYTVRALPVKSHEFQITGVCDIVEFSEDKEGVYIPKLEGTFRIRPVEYKRGKPKREAVDEVQLAAQVLCLEEMFAADIEEASFYYAEPKRREHIQIDQALRSQVKTVIDEMHAMFKRRHTPTVRTGPHCRACSLRNECLPKLMKTETAESYIERNLS
ncbi:CRISPR-associated protein Cas4 [Alkalicoccus urumqiensis]|uniref:CRISPR-associated exonuclease Cas4 n=1 Tax=Alkalicoccus urumqiensis TaxID=1548213 RepID=A0A2P6MLI3_ALKUR|nr:CRISPR-associated protein Cas4 [Alkalicoccus urumqiensis]PRO67120.1 CRISPR-associated protein Cas4 [Alkalicoccus urumqiensis]